MNQSPIFFLLGGADLEMQTIREILVGEGIPFADHNLRWDNALLSSYQKELVEHAESTIYGVELQEDIPFSGNYRSIDHHNQKSHSPSALEQVADLLSLPMNRYMQLVAANDKAYIPGMIALGASQKEVDTIRLADRKAQGVTEQEEAMAVKAVKENLEEVNGMKIVRALSSRFSPICDRLYPYRNLLVYTDTEWMYYGENTLLIRSMFEEAYQEGGLFYGGGTNGYVGIKHGFYTKDKVQEMVERIITINK